MNPALYGLLYECLMTKAKKAEQPDLVSSYEVAIVAIESLVEHPRNARTHSAEQVAEIVASIQTFGWTNPILAEISGDGVIAAGHGRRLAALKIYEAGGSIHLPGGRGIPRGTVPVIDCSGWSEAERRAYVLADNKLALNAGWDEGLLKLEIGAIREDGIAPALVGFSADEVDKMFASSTMTAPGEFQTFGEDIQTEHRCPKCGYSWSGKSS